MKRLGFFFFALLSATLLSGCFFTANLWKSTGYNDGNYFVVQAEDKIVGFGLSEKNAQPQLVMVGEQNWYVLSPRVTPIWQALMALRPQLSMPLRYSNYDMRIVMDSDGEFEGAHDGSTIGLWYCLDCVADPQTRLREFEAFNALNARFGEAIKPTSDMTRVYLHLPLSGQAYSKPFELPQQYRFPKAVPIQIGDKKTNKVDELYGLKLLATPFSILSDVIFLPIYALSFLEGASQ